MKSITIELVKGVRQELTFQGWKGDGLAFYATDPNGHLAMIVPVSAYSDDTYSGEPYRFPKINALGITPKRFNIAWSSKHRDVLRRWREARFAEIDALPKPDIYPLEGLQPEERKMFERGKSDEKGVIQRRYELLMAASLVELLDPIRYPGALAEFQNGRWADEMGEDFQVMLREVAEFNGRWHNAYDSSSEHTNYQMMLSDLCDVRFVMRGENKEDYYLTGVDMRPPTDQEAQAYVQMKQLLGGDTLPKQIDDITSRATATLIAAGERLTKVGQQVRADVEAGASTLGAQTKDLKEILGKVPELFADPLVAAARDASIKRGVPEVFTWWVFQERHLNKFPTVDDALKRSGLRPTLERAGCGFSRATVGRWLKIIREELDKRGLMPKRSPGRSSRKARDFDVTQAVDTGPRPRDADEPSEAFVKWVEERDAAGSVPTEQDVLAYLRDHAGDFDLASCSEDELQTTAARWLKDAVKILDLVPTGRLETNEEDSSL